MKSYVQVYSEKSMARGTASIGLAVRCAGAGLRVLAAFMKPRPDGADLRALKRFSDLIQVERFNPESWPHAASGDASKRAADSWMTRIGILVASGRFRLAILEQFNAAVEEGVIDAKDVLAIVANRHPDTEVVITGPNADESLIKVADLVTEQMEIKNPNF